MLLLCAYTLAGEPETLGEGSGARVSVSEDGTVRVFHTGRPDADGRPTALIESTLENGSWTGKTLLERPAFIPSGEWEIAMLGNGSYLLGVSLPRAVTRRGLTMSEMEWAHVVVPTFFEIRRLKMSESDRVRLGVTKEFTCGAVEPNQYMGVDKKTYVSDVFTDNNGDVWILADGLVGKVKRGRFARLDAPVAIDVKGGKIVRSGSDLVILAPALDGNQSVLKRITAADGKTFGTPETVITHFGASEIAVSASPDGVISLVYVKKDGEEWKIMRRTSTDNGKTWSAPEDLWSGDTRPMGLDAAVDKTGAIHLVWTEVKNGKKTVVYKKYGLTAE